MLYVILFISLVGTSVSAAALEIQAEQAPQSKLGRMWRHVSALGRSVARAKYQ